LAIRVERLGAKTLVLPDALPEVPEQNQSDIPGKESARLLFICTWASDEPFDEVIRAGHLLPAGVELLITGDSRGKEKNVEGGLPESVQILGFVDDEEFTRHLVEADVIIDLTKRQDCLVCGGYEAVAAGKPLIVSDTKALREFFRFGTIFTNNDAASIASAISRSLHERPRLTREMQRGREVFRKEWDTYYANVKQHIG